jgi:hypothetical protein
VPLLFTLHLAATWYMTGVIWVVQTVHYPMMGRVGNAFDDCQKFHLSRIGRVLGPPMLVEAATGAALLWDRSSDPVLWLTGVLLAVIWASTFLLQVPKHNRLACGFDSSTHRDLVRTNWIRTVAWSGRAVLLTWMAVTR